MSKRTKFKEFSEITTCHGIKDLYDASKVVEKLLWCFVLLAATGILLYAVVLSIQSYISASVAVTRQIVSEKAMKLPNLLICSSTGLNTTKMTTVGISRELIEIMQRYSTSLSINLANDRTTNLTSNTELEFKKYVKKYGSAKNFYFEFFFGCNEIVKFIGGASCIDSTPVFHPTTMYCYKIQTSFQYRTGIDSGIIMVLYQPKQNDPSLSTIVEFGFAIEVFDNVNPPIAFSPKLLPLNSMINIVMTKQKYERIARLESPKRGKRCSERLSSHRNCEFSCFAESSLVDCSCVLLGYNLENYTHDICSPFAVAGCILPKLTSLANASVSCSDECLPYCQEVSYNTEITSAVLESNTALFDSNKFKGISYVTVCFSSLSYEQITESDAYTITTLISNIGGQMGLFLGCSVVTIIQALLFFCRKYCNCCEQTAEWKNKDDDYYY